MTNIQPCPSCVETIADLRQAVSDAIHNAYVSGALDVHNNYQEDRDPSFGEAAADYVASLDVNDMLAHFLPKSPAQLLAEECPHGMTEEQAQWVLDQGYTKPFDFTDPRNFREAYAELTTPTDAALRYVFGPWVSASACLRCDMPSGANYQWRDKDHDTGEICARSEDGTWAEGVEIRRAYRIGQSYPHDGGECPLADGSVEVEVIDVNGNRYRSLARLIYWITTTSFTPLDQGSGQ